MGQALDSIDSTRVVSVVPAGQVTSAELLIHAGVLTTVNPDAPEGQIQ